MFLLCKFGWPRSARTRRITSSGKASLQPTPSSTSLLLICQLSHLIVKLPVTLSMMLWSRNRIDELLFVFQSQSLVWAYLSLGLLLAKACLANASIQIRVSAVTAKGLIRVLFSAGQCTECCQCQAENTHTGVLGAAITCPPRLKRKGPSVHVFHFRSSSIYGLLASAGKSCLMRFGRREMQFYCVSWKCQMLAFLASLENDEA